MCAGNNQPFSSGLLKSTKLLPGHDHDCDLLLHFFAQFLAKSGLNVNSIISAFHFNFSTSAPDKAGLGLQFANPNPSLVPPQGPGRPSLKILRQEATRT